MSIHLYDRRFRLFAGLFAAAAASFAPARVQSQALSRPERTRIVDSVAALARARYVFPALGDSIGRVLHANAERDKYNSDTTAAALASALTTELRALSSDRHFSILTPEAARQRVPVSAASGPGADPAAAFARLTARERGLNHYFRAYERMPGNVAYLALDQFPVPGPAQETAVAMMRLLANADAIILDLRTNPGGVEGLNQFLSSYFVTTPGGVLYQRYYRLGDSTLTVRVLPDVPGPRIPDTPLYILISRRTGSAAENMAYTLQAHRRAMLVGDTTAGAANSSTVFPLPGGFVMQVPVGRVIQPLTKTNWEGVGVIPDVAVVPGVARDSAYALALRGLLAKATEADAIQELQRALKTLQPPGGGDIGAAARR